MQHELAQTRLFTPPAKNWPRPASPFLPAVWRWTPSSDLPGKSAYLWRKLDLSTFRNDSEITLAIHQALNLGAENNGFIYYRNSRLIPLA